MTGVKGLSLVQTFRFLPRKTLSFSTSACAIRFGSVNSTYAYLHTLISVPSLAAKLLPGSEDGFATA